MQWRPLRQRLPRPPQQPDPDTLIAARYCTECRVPLPPDEAGKNPALRCLPCSVSLAQLALTRRATLRFTR